jgi:molybdopterin-guanine dinucleotide biosynthesis protein A
MNSDRIIGLIAAGGKSSRMGLNKSGIAYHGIAQVEWLKIQMNPLAEKVLVSVSEENVQGTNTLVDHPLYRDKGPIASLLSFAEAYPGWNVLVIACDYPFFGRIEMNNMLKADRNKPIAAWNEIQGFYHPYLAYYPSSFLKLIKSGFLKGITGMQKILQTHAVEKYIPENPDALLNANTPADLDYTIEKIRQLE